MLLTYPYFFVDISSLLYEQTSNKKITTPHSRNEWSILLNIEKKNNGKVEQYIKHFFLL